MFRALRASVWPQIPTLKIRSVTRLTLERELRKQFQRLTPGVVLDVGAKAAPYQDYVRAKRYVRLDIDPAKLDPIGFKMDVTKLDFQANKEEFERQFLISALRAFKGRINQTALHANIPKKTLLRKLEKYGIVAKDYIEG